MSARRVKKPEYGNIQAWLDAGYSLKTAKSEAYRKSNYPDKEKTNATEAPTES